MFKTPMTEEQYAAVEGLRCPACGAGGSELETQSIQADGSLAWAEARCRACKSTWTDLYTLTGYNNLRKENG